MAKIKQTIKATKGESMRHIDVPWPDGPSMGIPRMAGPCGASACLAFQGGAGQVNVPH
jgi:hypothetical protein